uniref:EF-hand domain-containing protein n=1 Tax=Hemiselmis andersenii TaxID=464988 RepID=A0A6U4ML33_HEMAN|mmetsp:Transcript_15771/g.36362  ORF Transcript_15771/g.36362 Transcript_15771/m.36362 type:complete len:182 (+) Transcript_15771:42-587(+)
MADGDDEKARLKRSKQGLTEEQIMLVREVFDAFDTDGGGTIDVDELRAAMKALGQNRTKAEVKALMEEIDSSGEGVIDFSEFMDFMKPMILAEDLEKEVRLQFQIFADEPKVDDEGNVLKDKYDVPIPGYITIDGLRKVSEKSGEMASDEELAEIIEYVTDGDDRIDEPTFLKVCKAMRLF